MWSWKVLRNCLKIFFDKQWETCWQYFLTTKTSEFLYLQPRSLWTHMYWISLPKSFSCLVIIIRTFYFFFAVSPCNTTTPCSNGGTCHTNPYISDGYFCTCTNSYTGKNCTTSKYILFQIIYPVCYFVAHGYLFFFFHTDFLLSKLVLGYTCHCLLNPWFLVIFQ